MNKLRIYRVSPDQLLHVIDFRIPVGLFLTEVGV